MEKVMISGLKKFSIGALTLASVITGGSPVIMQDNSTAIAADIAGLPVDTYITGKWQGESKEALEPVSRGLIDAVVKGKTNEISYYLQLGAGVNVKDKNGRTSLHWAARSGNADAVNMLTEHGADVNAKDNNGKTPLHEAVFNGNPTAIKLLLDLEADINARTNYNETPLHYAAEFGKAEAVEMLIKHEADLDARDKYGKTYLDFLAHGVPYPLIPITVHGYNIKVHGATRGELQVIKSILSEIPVPKALESVDHGIYVKDDAGIWPFFKASGRANSRSVPFIGGRIIINRNNGYTKYILYHEIGHTVDFYNNHVSKRKDSPFGKGPFITSYAKKDAHEDFADTFADLMMNWKYLIFNGKFITGRAKWEREMADKYKYILETVDPKQLSEF